MEDALLSLGIIYVLLSKLSLLNWSFVCGFVIGCIVMTAGIAHMIIWRVLVFTADGVDLVDITYRRILGIDLRIGETMIGYGLVAGE